jgi:NADPH:quinone reductase-like Zn-dependent oxidoreductase
MPTMKAVRMHAYGGAEVLTYEEAPRPEVKPGEVLIRVRAAGVNPVDWKIREGYGREFFGHRLPLIPGWDVAGVVEAAAPGANRLRPGDEVFAFTSLQRDGAYAEFVAAPDKEVARKPETLNFVEAAAVPVGSLTSWQALFEVAGLRAGQTVLVHAAAGGVGSLAVQLTRWKGARVLGTASARNADFLHGLGVDQVIDYKTQRFEDLARDVDVVFDTVGGETQRRSWSVLKRGGFLVSIVEEPPEAEARRHGVRAAFLGVRPDAGQLEQVARLIDAGHLRPCVEKVLPLREVRQAHELSQSGHVRGKIVLTP